MSRTVLGYHLIAEFGRCECDQLLLYFHIDMELFQKFVFIIACLVLLLACSLVGIKLFQAFIEVLSTL